MSETTTDAFLGGRLSVLQPANGYRAGADPVFLAAAVPARPGERILELGCGAGVALLCLLARVPEAHLTGVERDPGTAELARGNVARNGLAAEILCEDIARPSAALRAQSFDHVMANPPFFDRSRGSRATLDTREAARGLEVPLETWADAAIRRLAPGGTFTIVNRTEQLPACLAALDGRVGDLVVKPLAPRAARPAKLFLLQAKKGARGPFCLAPPLILHQGDRHAADGDSYTEEAAAILRDGAPLVTVR
jgi:tRNA1(Val) A37 N6-methylase TrmN6